MEPHKISITDGLKEYSFIIRQNTFSLEELGKSKMHHRMCEDGPTQIYVIIYVPELLGALEIIFPLHVFLPCHAVFCFH